MFRNESGFYHSFVSLELSPAGISNASVTPLYRKMGVFAPKALSRGDGPISTADSVDRRAGTGRWKLANIAERRSRTGDGEVPPAPEGGCPCAVTSAVLRLNSVLTPSRRYLRVRFVVSSPS